MLRFSLALFACLVLMPAAVEAQERDPSDTALFVELAGSGLFYSVNYESRVRGPLNARIGFMAVNQTINDQGGETIVGVLLVPLMANVLVGGGDHRLEIGAGPLVGLAGTGVNSVRHHGAEVAVKDLQVAGLTSSVGYRYHPVRGGVLFRATATPFYSSSRAQLWGGISVGWAM